jgi:hypothetical protein
MKNKKMKVKPLFLKTLLSVVQKSVGTKMFQTIWAEVGGAKKDITEGGNISCAFYVSGVLAMFDLIDRVHATVSGTIKAMEETGWKKTKVLAPGVVIMWGPAQDGNFNNNHLGFCLDETTAISNIWQKKVPMKHHITFGSAKSKNYRPILAIYTHSKLKS